MRTEIILYLFILCNIHAIITKSLTDYTFYFQSYHYEFSNKDDNNNHKSLISNDDITIQLDIQHNNLYIIDNHQTLNFSNDSDFNEINLIIAHPNHQSTNRRQLLWNKWDHTTSKHLRKGRFVGDAAKLRTFEDARSLCREYYGDIGTIQTKKENKEFQTLCKQIGKKNGDVSKSCWIGLTQPYYEWENSQYVSFSNWAPHKPANSIDEKCSYMDVKTGKWDDYPCNRELYAICEKPLSNYHGNYVVVSKQTTKRKAMRFCKKKFGSTLASIITPTDAIEAHEACKMVAKAPHGCWIGLTAPYKKWDNGLTVQPIKGRGKGSNMDWKGGKIPNNKELKCVEMDKDGYWRGIPCDYERHIICNVHGVDTKQGEQDKEFLEKQAEELRQKKLREKERAIAKQKRENTQDRNEENIVSGTTGGRKGPNPSSPIEKQIDVLKKILKEQQVRLANERSKFEGKIGKKNKGGIHKLSQVEGMKEMDEHHGRHGHGHGHGANPMQGLKDEIQRLQGIGHGGMGEIQSVYGLSQHKNPASMMNNGNRGVGMNDRMGRVRRQTRMRQRSQMANGGGGGGMNAFGGAFGGSLGAGVGNPYSGSGSGRGMPPPMNYGQYAMMMNRMNPMRLPRVSQGLYAHRRRLMSMSDMNGLSLKSIRKCVWSVGKEICVWYDYGRGVYEMDVRICSDIIKRGDDYNNSVYKYICDRNDDEKFNDGYIKYLLVYEFNFVFSDSDKERRECGEYGEYNVCMDGNDKIVYVYDVNENEYMFDYNNDYEWNEIYIGGENRKCVYLSDDYRIMICLIEDNVDKYRLEMKFQVEKDKLLKE